MSRTFLMSLTPMEPYFFGNEKTFFFDSAGSSAKNRYFIRSERMPMQTTLLGALRYLLMPVKHSNFCYTPEEAAKNAEIIGPESFDIRKEKQSFGVIEKISPVFLQKDSEIYLPTPLDHRKKDGETNNTRYTPFSSYERKVETDQGSKWIPMDFITKDGMTDSYMSVDSGTIVEASKIFRSVVRVGQNKTKDKKAFFKKQYSALENGWSFGAYIKLNMSELNQRAPQQAAALQKVQLLYLGQNKTAFCVRFTEAPNCLAEAVKKHLTPGFAYCLSDAYVHSDIHNKCYFSAIQLRDYRAYFTHSRKDNKDESKITKGTELYKLVKAGSVFIPKDKSNFLAFFDHTNCTSIGFNEIAIKEDESNDSTSV